MGLFVAAREVSKISAMRRMYALQINHSLGSSFVIQIRIELVRYEGVPARNEVISSEEAFWVPASAISVFFARVLAVSESDMFESTLMSASMLGLAFVEFNVLFRDDFLDLTLD